MIKKKIAYTSTQRFIQVKENGIKYGHNLNTDLNVSNVYDPKRSFRVLQGDETE